MTKYLLIEADCNDADYVAERTEITDEALDRVRPVINAIKARSEAFKRTNKWPQHNWVTSEYSSEPYPSMMYREVDGDLIDEFGEYVPHGEYGIHTIVSIKVVEVVENLL